MAAQDPYAVAALRAGSVEAREPLSRAAGDDPWLLGELARVVASQDLRPGDRAEALRMLAGAGPLAPEHQGLHAQLTFALGDRLGTAELLQKYPDMPEAVHTGLSADLANPYAGGNGNWAFALLMPAPAVQVADGPGVPFDRLTTATPQRVGNAARSSTAS